MTGKIVGIVVVVFFCITTRVLAQQTPTPNPILRADSLATGNYKDVLNSFFQLAFDRLSNPDKSIRFTGTPFAVMAKLDTTLLVDTSYKKYTALRNLNYMFALRLDTSFKFNGFSSGIKYAIINKRDVTVSKAFLNTVIRDTVVKQLYSLNANIIAKIQTMANSDSLQREYINFTFGKINFGALSLPLHDALLAAANNDSTRLLFDVLKENKNFNMKKFADNLYKDMVENFNNNALWTVGVTDTTLKNQFVFSNVVFHTEFLKGINKFNKTKNDLELDIKSQIQLVDDTLKAGQDLKRAIFNFEPGINWVLKTRTTKKSYLELKFSGGYYRNLSTLYASDDRDRIFVNGTVRVRIFSDIWVPFEVKYDPRNGNLLGFINVRANFRALAGAAKQLL
ncbi:MULTISPECIES: hypothetical protein [Niastella]|uniref:Uncharacterized protein n=1 Tax=Niastella soli TaxID=2821487 RepID=A0ABS3YNB0_9BACT|nr:hypothetical protein [Niastella soli]MBO9199367.1 hypothetical protein [Niastella soli]